MWYGVTSSFAVRRAISPPASRGPNLLLGYWTTGLNFQLTEQWLVFADVDPWGSLGDLGEGIELSAFGGTSFTFNHNAQVTFEAGNSFIVDPPPRWNRFVPESFATLSLVFWY